jgi:hypothetical protein
MLGFCAITFYLLIFPVMGFSDAIFHVSQRLICFRFIISIVVIIMIIIGIIITNIFFRAAVLCLTEIVGHLKYNLMIQSTPQRKQHVSVTNISWLMLFIQEIPACPKNHTNVNTLCVQNTDLCVVKLADTYSYNWALKG